VQRGRILDPLATAPSLARDFALETANRFLDDQRREILLLLTSEVVTNAVKHAGTRIVLRVSASGSAVCVEVQDACTAAVAPVQPRGADGGFGLNLVERLADAWGVDGHANGKTVWFEIDTRPHE
jgi:anti-sigma regulatory factor (Ser/Thr protein kinase)